MGAAQGSNDKCCSGSNKGSAFHMSPPHVIGRHVTAERFICRRLKSNNAEQKHVSFRGPGKKEEKKNEGMTTHFIFIHTVVYSYMALIGS